MSGDLSDDAALAVRMTRLPEGGVLFRGHPGNAIVRNILGPVASPRADGWVELALSAYQVKHLIAGLRISGPGFIVIAQMIEDLIHEEGKSEGESPA